MFGSVYEGKTVLVTGHTGFKGSWLTTWLLELGANVIGLSKDVPTSPSLFELCGLGEKIADLRQDVRDLPALRSALNQYRPDFVFHLAAQPLVSVSYADPAETYTTNAIGTFNVLEALRTIDWRCNAVMITSDKCYDNVEWVWGYRETDALGGKDVYSGSKGAAELIIKSMFHSFFSADDPKVRIGVARAGNVIGGGDWAQDRIVVDAVDSWRNGQPVVIRSPNATRPWQHVLEPLSGYLRLGQLLANGSCGSGSAFNFGPNAQENHTVADLLKALFSHWAEAPHHAAFEVEETTMPEAGLLKLNCDKALDQLDWTPTLSFAETSEITSLWYKGFYLDKHDPVKQTEADLSFYVAAARDRMKSWAS